MCKKLLVLLVLLVLFEVSCHACLPADINRDGVVNNLDFAILAQQWLCSSEEEWFEVMGSYVQFSDTGRISFPFHPVFEIEGDYSMSIWTWTNSKSFHHQPYIKLNAFPIELILIDVGTLQHFNSDAIPGFTIAADGKSTTVDGTNAIIENKWNHIVVVKDDSSAEVLVYLNGVLENKSINNHVGPVVIGAGNSGFGFSTIYSVHSTDNFRIYKNHALSQTEVTSIYNNGTPIAATDADFAAIDGFYVNFDEGQGTIVTGRVVINGVANDLQNNLFAGGVDWRDESDLPFGGVSYLHGTSDASVVWIDDSDKTDPEGRDFTVALWVNFDNIVAQSIISKHNGTDGFKIEMTSTGTIEATIGASLVLESVASLSRSTWHHIVLSQDISGTTSLYVNNVVVSSAISESSDNTTAKLTLFPNTFVNGSEGFGIDSLIVFLGTFKDAAWVNDEYNNGQGRELDVLHFNVDRDGILIDEDVYGFQTNFLYSSTGERIWTAHRSLLVEDFYSESVSGTLTWLQGGFPFSISQNDINFFATSLEPNMTQVNFSQSIGGYPSLSTFSPETVTTQHVGLNDTVVEIKQPVGGFVDWIKIEYLGINDEIIEVEKVDGLIVNVETRGVSGVVQSHPKDSLVKGLSSENIFNDVLSRDFKQYRCLAIHNLSVFETAYNMGVYIPQNSRSVNSIVKIAVEKPKNQSYIGTSTSWDNMKIIDSNLINTTEDYTDANLTIDSGPNSGQSRIVSSFDSFTGIMVLKDSLPVDFDSSVHNNSVSFSVAAGPAQRINSGIVSPFFGTGRVGELSVTTKKNPVSIDIHGEGGNKKHFRPGEVLYVWLERSLKKSSPKFINNSFSVKTTYSLVI